VLLRVLKVPPSDPLLWQRALLTAEVEGLLAGHDSAGGDAGDVVASAAVRTQYARLAGGGGGGGGGGGAAAAGPGGGDDAGGSGGSKQRPVEGDCPSEPRFWAGERGQGRERRHGGSMPCLQPPWRSPAALTRSANTPPPHPTPPHPTPPHPTPPHPTPPHPTPPHPTPAPAPAPSLL
jgi:hypothetical protein